MIGSVHKKCLNSGGFNFMIGLSVCLKKKDLPLVNYFDRIITIRH